MKKISLVIAIMICLFQMIGLTAFGLGQTGLVVTIDVDTTWTKINKPIYSDGAYLD